MLYMVWLNQRSVKFKKKKEEIKSAQIAKGICTLSCCKVTLLEAVGQEWIAPKYTYFNVCYNERGSGTNYVHSSIPHCILSAFLL